MKKMLSLLLVMAMVVCMLAACGQNPAPTEPGTQPNESVSNEITNPPETNVPESETALKLAWVQGIGTDTYFQSPHQGRESMWVDAVFEPLMYDDGENNYIPVLATDISVNEDGTVWTLTIADGITWHDGEPFTVDDVVWSVYNAILNPNGGAVTDFWCVKGQEALINGETDTLEGLKVDGNKIIFELIEPYIYFDAEVTSLYVLPEHLLGEYDFAEVNTADYWKKPIGTGAYKIDQVSFPDYFTCTRYEGYHGEPAGIKNLYFKSYAAGGADAAQADMATGDLDFLNRAAGVTADGYKYLASTNSDVVILDEVAYNIRMFAFNIDKREDGNNKEALKNNLARRAIAMLVDSQAIATYVGGGANVSETLVSPVLPDYNDQIAFDKKNDYDTAKAWLTEAGWDFDNDVLDLAYYYGDQTSIDCMTLIAANLAKIDVKVNLISLAGVSDLADQLYKISNFDMLYLQGGTGPKDTGYIYYQFTDGRSYTFIGNDDVIFPKYTAKHEAYMLSADQAEKSALCKELQAMAYEDCYIFPLYFTGQQEAYNSAKVDIPEEVFIRGGEQNMKWSEWKILY